MNIPEHVKQSAFNTLGYKEAENKESFTVGASVAFQLAQNHYQEEIRVLKQRLQYMGDERDSVRADITHLSKIVKRYMDCE